MYLIGNPLIVWGCAGAVAIFVVLALVAIPAHLVKPLSQQLMACIKLCR